MELKFWLDSVDFLDGKPIWFSSGATRLVYSDASTTGYGGYGGYMVELGNDIAHGQWSADESGLSSTWRELKAVYLVLSSFATKLAGHTVKRFTDNQGVVHIVRKEHIQDDAMAIFEINVFSIASSWRWSGFHVLRMKGPILSVGSLTMTNGAWTLVCFRLLMQAGDPTPLIVSLLRVMHCYLGFTVDSGCLAEKQLIHSPLTGVVSELNWWLPLLYLVCRTIYHALSCQAKGTPTVPAWKSAPYWPIICPDGWHLASFIHLWWPIEFYQGLFQDGRSSCNVGNSLTDGTIILALFIDFTVAPRLTHCGFCAFNDYGICDVCM